MKKYTCFLILFLAFLITNTRIVAQNNPLLPLITYDCNFISGRINDLHFNEGINPLCTTTLGNRIYAIVQNGSVQSYIIKTNSGDTIPYFSAKLSRNCGLDYIKNCNIIPKKCFCEIKIKK
jgi:hypothetical protein